MRDFVFTHIIKPFKGKWLKGFTLLTLWTIAFVALPSISGWFLAICSVVFVTANTAFAYLIPSAIIRLLSLFRTATRYFERLENHKTTLSVQQSLQLNIFKSIARLPFIKKQVNNNSSLLENSTHGVDQLLNHILLWILPFTALLLTIAVYFIFLLFFSKVIAIEFIISSAILLFLIPQIIFRRNRILSGKLKSLRVVNHQDLIQSFRGRIEISKYNLEDKAIDSHEKNRLKIEGLEKKLQFNSFNLQLIVGLGFSYIAAFLLWHSSKQPLDAPIAIGIFFGIMAQAELSEILFAGKSERSSVEQEAKDMEALFEEGSIPVKVIQVKSQLKLLSLKDIEAVIPDTTVHIGPISFDIRNSEWVAVYGKTGRGKSTLLNSLFYPEYRENGLITWNDEDELINLPVPTVIYVTQKAYLLTGTLRENFEGYPDEEIAKVLDMVDLTSWWIALPDGLDTWIGENGETLSGGQRKKLLLAQALLKRPQLLVVDEPTAGISTENAIEIFKNIRSDYPDISILMATHMKEFESVVDKVIRI